MKMISIFALLILFLTSCGNSFKAYSKTEKKEVVEKIFKNDPSAKIQYDNILKELMNYSLLLQSTVSVSANLLVNKKIIKDH